MARLPLIPVSVLVLLALLVANTSQQSAETALTSLVDELLRLAAVEQQQQQNQHQNQSLAANSTRKPQTATRTQLRRPNNNGSSLAAVRQRWRQMEQSVAASLASTSGQLRRKLDELLLVAPAVSPECRSKLQETLEALKEQQLWASSMLDASARLPSGLLAGTLTELGNFDQCLGQAQGQYCSLQVRPAMPARPRHHTICQRLAPLSNSLANNSNSNSARLFRRLAQHSHHFHYAGLRLGVCTPSRCSRADLQHLLNAYLADFELVGQVRGCQSGDDVDEQQLKLDGLQQSLVAVFVLLLGLVLAGTLIDCSSPSPPKTRRQTMEPRARRWHHYQVYQADLVGASCQHQVPGVQRNPLLVVAPGHLKSPANQSTDNNLDEEANWISQLEREHLEGKAARRPIRPLLTCFSLRLSLRSIGRTSGKKQDDWRNVRVVHGLRSLAMIWIIFGHTLGLANPEMLNNLFAMAQLSCSSRLLQVALNATLAVNSFFMISGFVTALSLGRKCKSMLLDQDDDQDGAKMEKQSSKKASVSRAPLHATGHHHNHRRQSSDSSGKGSLKSQKAESHRQKSKSWPADFRPLRWILMRYLRLTPAYAATIAAAILLPALGSGPFWQESVTSVGAQCRANWWTNLLYANNFLNTQQLCLIHSWYLSNDCQFFLLALVLMGLLHKSRRLATCLLLILVFSGAAATFVVTVANDFPPTIVSTSPAQGERWLFIHSLYYKPWPHLGSYLVGLVTGYLLLVSARPRVGVQTRRWCWLVFGLMALALLNSIYPWNMGFQVEPTLAGLHAATFRTLWSLCCAWFLYALATADSWLSKLLGWHGFQVTSRLTYCAYLVHPLVIHYHFGRLRERLDSSIYGQTQRFLSTLFSSYLFALVLTVLVEAPLVRLQTLLATGLKEEQEESTLAATAASTTEKKKEKEKTSGANSNLPSSAASSTGSWTGTSSFGDQNSALISSSSLGKELNLSTCGPNQSPVSNSVASNFIGPTGEEDNLTTGALDVDFQRKLAQAIGRGFRIRSRMANSNSSSSNSNSAPTLNGGNMSKQCQQQVQQAKRSPTQPLERLKGSSSVGISGHQHQQQRRLEFSTFLAAQTQQVPSVDANHHNQQDLRR